MRPIKAAKRRQARREQIEELLSPKASRKLARQQDNALIDTEEKVGEWYQYAREIYLLQDAKTRDAIDAMVEKMLRMAGDPVVKYQGAPVPADLPRLQQLQDKLLVWAAVRLFVACAAWDIQIANFRLPSDKCAKCGRPVKRR